MANLFGQVLVKICESFNGLLSVAKVVAKAKIHRLVLSLYTDLSWDGSEFSAEQYAQVTSQDKDAWQRELASHDELFAKIADKLPASLIARRKELGEKIAG